MKGNPLMVRIIAGLLVSWAVSTLMVPRVGQAQAPRYEVWAIDQADVGQGGARLHMSWTTAPHPCAWSGTMEGTG